MKLKERVSAIIDYCTSKGIAFSFWKHPKEQTINGLLSNEVSDRPYDLKNDVGFCLNKFEDQQKYTLLKPNLVFQIGLESKNISILENDNTLISSEDFLQIAPLNQWKKSNTSTELVTYSKPLFLQNVEKGITRITEGTLDKVVVSKFKEHHFSAAQLPFLYKKLYTDYATAFVHMSYLPGEGTWIGATPETLLSYDNSTSLFKTVALAGTQKALNTSTKEAVWRQKEIEEQALVSRYIINCFKKIRLRDFGERGPKTIQAGKLWHLFTEFVVDNAKIKLENLADKMLVLLHPTSAVCGMPLEASQKFILENEQYNRSYFSGFVGPINMFNKTHLFVNLRCGNILNGKIRLFAGAGITTDSNAEKEWEETEMKCQILLDKIKEIEADAKHS